MYYKQYVKLVLHNILPRVIKYSKKLVLPLRGYKEKHAQETQQRKLEEALTYPLLHHILHCHNQYKIHQLADTGRENHDLNLKPITHTI